MAFELTVESVLGVDDKSLSEGIAMYLNPATSNVTIANATNIQLDPLAIYDANGRLVHIIDLTHMIQKRTIDVSRIASGVYLVQFHAEGASTVKRLIRQCFFHKRISYFDQSTPSVQPKGYFFA